MREQISRHEIKFKQDAEIRIFHLRYNKYLVSK
jgi:hypothetical protein